MAYTKEHPKVTNKRSNGNRETETLTHPAFGSVVVTRPSSSGGATLFDSAVKHQNFVSVSVHEATVDRSLNQNWVHTDRTIVEFNMSEAQWAHFVSSAGFGAGTPVTLRYKPAGDYKLMDVPGIASIETMKQTYEREMREDCKRYIAELKEVQQKIVGLATTGKANKTQLNEIAQQLSVFLQNMPSNMAFTQSQFAEAMEKTVEAGKSDLEAFVLNLSIQTGLDVLRERQIQLSTDTSTDTTPRIEQ